MNVDARMQLTMSQRLVMTPMLQQAIKLLQMSRLELVELVKQELLENPVLDELEEVESYANYREGQEEDVTLTPFEENLQREQTESNFEAAGSEGSQNLQEHTISWEDYFEDNPAGLGGDSSEKEFGEQNQTYDHIIGQRQSLAEHLAWQLQMSRVSERMMKIGMFLIGQIDENGYMRGDGSALFGPDRHHADLRPDQLEEYRTQVIEGLRQKINAAFEREYLATALDTSSRQGILLNLLLQEHYDEVLQGHYDLILAKLQAFTLEDLEMLTKLMAEFSAESLAALTGLPASEIESGLDRIRNVCRDLREIIEQHFTILTKGKYEAKLEKIQLAAEELYLLEYFLLQLSAEEITYIVAKENASKIAKREKEVETLLEKLRQSYAHIETLQSHKYFLIQLYRVGVGLLSEKFQAAGPGRFQKLFLKLQHLSVDDVASVARQLAALTAQYYKTMLPVSFAEMEHTLRHIQTFAPPGVGARDLKECLTIQARNLGMTDTPVELIIRSYLRELQEHQYARIASELGITIETVGLLEKIIANMSPQPGADFTTEPPEYIVPDIYVYKVNSEYEVVLNEDDLPSLRINPVYKKLLVGNNQGIPNATRQYVDQKLRSAMWFIRSVEQRKRTIYKVGKSIVKFQREFLEHGISHLKPLVLRDVADDIAMHESTVSRVTTSKYIHTPQGVFELKYFFHSGLESSSGKDISSIAVKERIKQLILEENSSRPLSDQALEKILKQQGIAIARRTIAKYREELHIPSSVNRKNAVRTTRNDE